MVRTLFDKRDLCLEFCRQPAVVYEHGVPPHVVDVQVGAQHRVDGLAREAGVGQLVQRIAGITVEVMHNRVGQVYQGRRGVIVRIQVRPVMMPESS